MAAHGRAGGVRFVAGGAVGAALVRDQPLVRLLARREPAFIMSIMQAAQVVGRVPSALPPGPDGVGERQPEQQGGDQGLENFIKAEGHAAW